MNLLIFIFTFSISFSSYLAQNIIPPGSIVSASDTNSAWHSPNRTYSFRFITQTQLDPTTTSSSGFYAAILYDGNIPIWVASDSQGVPAPADELATLNLAENGNLFVRNGSTTSGIVWQSNTASIFVESAALEDSGNFVLKNSTNSRIWSTFDHPTDTIVPSQNLSVNQSLRSGLYMFRLLNNGNLTLSWNNTIQYYNSGFKSSANVNFTSPSLTLRPIGALSIIDPSREAATDIVFSSDYAEAGDILRFLSLGSDGNLRIYSSKKGSGTKDVRWSAVSDQCKVFGYCGNNGICSYNETSPVCGCASENFELVDQDDRRKGCRRKVDLNSCRANATMFLLENAMFLTYGREFDPGPNTEAFSIGISACRLNCLTTSGCVASTAVADGTGFCYLKTNDVTDFVSGYLSPALPSTSFVKVCPPVLLNPPATSSVGEKKDGWKLKAWVVVVVVVITILILIALEGSLWWWCFRNSPKFGALSSQYALLEYASGAPVQFTYKELQKATKGFKEKLGAGGFGTVYRGVLANRSIVAVKQLEGIEQGEKQFRMEVATISSTHHLNLVRLIGFCSEGRHRLLVYEFMKNGSLDNFLFQGEQQRKVFSWEQRYNIALGTARGITYLHEECRDCIVHCDIKPENILLDDNYSAKVSDFGLAKLVNSKDHRYRTLTSIRGTRGYLAPEWLANLPITSKSDVYSYGMVLLEIVSGKRNFEVSSDTNQKKFSLWAYEEFDKGNAQAIVDKTLPISDTDMEQVVRAIQVSFWCIQEQPSQRPMMSKVVQMMEGISVIEKPPAPKIITEGSIGGTSVNASAISSHSIFASSPPAPSSLSSLQTAGVTPSVSAMDVERSTSSLLIRR
ncbi:hypothetical protein Leryth_003479 [Lithospermum erythrorhizon]|nr:hypothetical protein Leryth_003479 [Lithospermum erythrorhizon]